LNNTLVTLHPFVAYYSCKETTRHIIFVLTLDSLKHDSDCASVLKETVFLSFWSTGETWQHKNYKIFNSASAVIYIWFWHVCSGILCVTWQNYMWQHRL